MSVTTLQVTRQVVVAPHGAAPRTSHRRADAAAVAAFLALGLLVMANYLADPGGRISGHLPVDNTWFEWLLAHGAYSVRHLSNPLFSAAQNVPAGVNMMANTSVLGVTIPLAPVTLLLGPKIVYVLWIVGACAATATTTYWALSRRLVQSRAAAFAGGALAGFAPGVVHHANGQPNFVSNFLLPVLVVRVLRLGVTDRWVREGVVLALLVIWQVFINEELLLVTAAACAVALFAHARQRRAEARRRARAFAAALGVTAAVAVTVLAYPLWMQFHGPQSYHALPLFHAWGEDVAAYVTMPRDSVGGVAGAEATVGRTEQNTWFGWPLMGLVVVLAVALWKRSVAARTAVVVSVVFAVGALGPRIRFDGRLTDLPGPWLLIPNRTPVLGLMMPSRLTFAVAGAFVVLVALGWDELAGRDRRTPRGPADPSRVGRMLIAAALIPLIPTPVPAVADQPPPLFITSGAWRAWVPAGTTLVPVPLPDNGGGRGTLAWNTVAEHEFAVPRGYFLGPDTNGDARMGPAVRSVTAELSGYVVRTGRLPLVTPADRAAVRAELRQWHAAVVVLGPQPAEVALKSLLEELFGPGRREQDVWLWDAQVR